MGERLPSNLAQVHPTVGVRHGLVEKTAYTLYMLVLFCVFFFCFFFLFLYLFINIIYLFICFYLLICYFEYFFFNYGHSEGSGSGLRHFFFSNLPPLPAGKNWIIVSCSSRDLTGVPAMVYEP